MHRARKLSPIVLCLSGCIGGGFCQAACSQAKRPDGSAIPGEERINTTVFYCTPSATRPGFEFTVRQGPGEIALWLPQEFDRPYLVLSQDFDASGTTFREGGVEVTYAQSGAMLAINGERFSDCSEDSVRSAWEHAKLSGVDYRATGLDPDWYLEIRNGGNLVFRSISTEVRISLPTPDADAIPQLALTRYQALLDGMAFVVEISSIPCTPADGLTTTGSSVQVSWRNDVFQGCGRSLH